MLRQPLATIIAAPVTAATTIGTRALAAARTTPANTSSARLAWVWVGTSRVDHSMSSTSGLALSASRLGRSPRRSRTSPASSRISSMRLRIMRERRWMPSTTQSV